MKRFCIVVSSVALALAAAACAGNQEMRWYKEGATQNQLESDLFWCQRVEREQYERHNNPQSGRRQSHRYIDAECMRERGWERRPAN